MKRSFFSRDLSGCCLRFATVAAILIIHPVALATAAGIEHKHNINILRLTAQTNILADRGDDAPPPIPDKPGGRR